jgi:hypothetical protein
MQKNISCDVICHLWATSDSIHTLQGEIGINILPLATDGRRGQTTNGEIINKDNFRI